MTDEVAYRPLPLDPTSVRYAHGRDSVVQAGVPQGSTISFEWTHSATPGTSRTVWVHVPAQYRSDEPASLLVFQDGWLNLDPHGEVRGAIVLDNLINRGDLPVTIGVLVDPGVNKAVLNPDQRRNRNEEYDAFDTRYVTFLIDEILAEVRQHWTITDNPKRWAICRISSGGNCAFTAAWLRPDAFRRAICFLSSFTQMPGGNPYPDLIPVVPPKPVRVFPQTGHRDLYWNEPQRNWFANNLRVGAALAEGGYDVRLVLGDGGHHPNHAGVLLPDALRWVFRADSTAAGLKTSE